MKVGELIQEVREDYLDDDVEPFLWKQSTLLRFLSRAQDEVAMRQRILVDNSTAEICSVTIAADTPSYDLDSRIVLIESVGIEGEELTKWTIPKLNRRIPSWRLREGYVDGYLQEGLTITLLPTPTAAEDTKTLDLKVWRMPLVPLTTLDQEPEIPVQYHRDLIWFVIAEAFGLPDEDTQDTRKADFYMKRFEATFGPALPADVLANRRRELDTTFIGPSHAYHGRRSVASVNTFDFD